MRTIIKFLAACLCVVTAQAANVSWTNTLSATFTNAANWNPAGLPTINDDVYITNYIGATSVTLTNRGTSLTNANLTIFNTAAGIYTLLLSNSVYQITNTTVFGANTVVQLGAGNSGSESVLSNNNLYLAGNSVIAFNGNAGNLNNQLLVAGVFTNSSNSAITNRSGGFLTLQFTGNTLVTNQGRIAILGLNAGSAGQTGLVLAVANNTLHNAGTILLGNAGSTATRSYVFSNQLVNAGTFVLTNNTANATNFFSVTVGSLTNFGTLKLYAGAANSANAFTLNTGHFVNTGTLIADNGANTLTLADPTGIFSNALGGTVIATNAAQLILQAPATGDGAFKVAPGATLTFASGGALHFGNTLFHTGATIVIRGPMNNTQVGAYSSVGTLLITTGTLTQADSLLLGHDTGNLSTVTVANAGNLAISNAQLIVGGTGTGVLNLNPGGNLFANQFLATNNVAFGVTNSIFNFNGGTLTTSNAPGTLAASITVQSNLAYNILGNWHMLGGTNQLTMLYGFAGLSLNVYFGGSAGTSSSNTILVGADAVWNLSGNFNTIQPPFLSITAASNTVLVRDGGKVFTPGVSLLGNGSNRMVVTGPGSAWNANSFVISGYSNSALVANGGALYATAGGFAVNGGSSLLVTDPGSVATGTSLFIGSTSSNNFVTIANGGIMVVNSTAVGAGGGGIYTGNVLTVTGPGSVLTNTSSAGGIGALRLGDTGTDVGNRVVISAGGMIVNAAGDTQIGRGSGNSSNNSVLVTGPGSVLTNFSNTLIGVTGGSNTLTMAAGGLVINTTGIIGQTGSNNLVTVTDAGSAWTNTALILGQNAGSTGNKLLVQNAGQVISSGNVTIGNAAGANSNNLTVTDAGSSLHAALITVGTGGSTGNVLAINNGGLVLPTGLTVSANAADRNNQVNVLGGALYLTNATRTAALTVGSAGTGSLTVSNTGFVWVDVLTLGATAGSAGSLTVGNGGLVIATNQALNPGTIAGASAFITLNTGGVLATTNTTLTLGQNGTGTFNFSGGAFSNVLSGAVNTLTQIQVGQGGVGTLGLSAGTLNVNTLFVTNNTATATNSLFNFTGGTLNTSNGTTAATLVIASNTTFNINGVWNMLGGNVLTRSATGGVLGTVSVGNGASNAAVNLSPNVAWNLSGLNLTIGNGAAASNSLNITTGNLVTNIGTLVMAGTGGSILISSGGVVSANGGVVVGTVAGSRGNVIRVSGSTLVSSNAGGTATTGIQIGGTAAGDAADNQLIIDNGGRVFALGMFNVGTGVGGGTNKVVIDGANSLLYVTGQSGRGQVVGGQISGSNRAADGSDTMIISNGAAVIFTGAGETYIGLSQITAPSSSNTVLLTDPGSVFSNTTSALYLGSGVAGASSNAFYIRNGAAFYGSSIYIGNANAGTLNSVVIDGGPQVSLASTLVSNSGIIAVGNAATAYNNNLTVSNATVFGGLYLGNNASSSNTATILDNVRWNFNGIPLVFNNGGGTNNVLTVVENGTTILTNVGGILLGGGGQTFALTNANGPSRNILLGNGGSLSVGNTPGLGGNTLLLSNQNYTGVYAVSSIIGNGSSNNFLTILPNTVWTNTGLVVLGTGAASGNVLTNRGRMYYSGFAITPLSIGFSAASTSNLLVISDTGTYGTFDTAGTGRDFAFVGTSGSGNGIIVSNGGTLYLYGNTRLGVNAGANGNYITVTGAGSTFTNPAGALGADLIGTQLIVGQAGSSNQFHVRDGGIYYGVAYAQVGATGSNNLVLVTDPGSRFHMADFGIGVGVYTGAAGNSFIVSNGATLITANTGGTGVTIGRGTNAAFNTLLITGATWSNIVNAAPILIGGPTAQSNTLTIANNGKLFGGVIQIGAGGSGNSLTIASGATVSNSSAVIGSVNALFVTNFAYVLPAGTTTNQAAVALRLDGGNNSVLVTDPGTTWRIAGALTNGLAGANQSLVISNGAAVFNATASIGHLSTYNTNVLTITANTSPATATVAAVNVILTNSAASVVVTGPGSTWQTTGSVILGNTGAGNSLTVRDGATVAASNLTVGLALSSTGNVAFITGNAVLEANTLIVSNAAAGNAITNNGGIYQFTTATPTLTTGVAIDTGIISYRAVTNANVANPLTGLSFAGNNTFRLNAATNATAGQTYTFDIGLGAANYTRLELISGATAYRGGDVTIGTGGSFLASNTFATITGTFTNNGVADVVNSTANFQTALHVAGTLTLRNGFVTGAGAKTVTGTLRGNGGVVGDATVSGNLSPGFSVGTLVFSNNLTLTGNYVLELDGTGSGTSDVIVVVQALTITNATLNITELAAADDLVYVIAAYGTLAGPFNGVTGLPSGYTLDYNYSGANQIAIVLVPEPGPMALTGLGLLALVMITRKRRK